MVVVINIHPLPIDMILLAIFEKFSICYSNNKKGPTTIHDQQFLH